MFYRRRRRIIVTTTNKFPSQIVRKTPANTRVWMITNHTVLNRRGSNDLSIAATMSDVQPVTLILRGRFRNCGGIRKRRLIRSSRFRDVDVKYIYAFGSPNYQSRIFDFELPTNDVSRKFGVVRESLNCQLSARPRNEKRTATVIFADFKLYRKLSISLYRLLVYT